MIAEIIDLVIWPPVSTGACGGTQNAGNDIVDPRHIPGHLALIEDLDRFAIEDGVVTVEILANFDYGNYTRLGYPIELVLTQGTTEARLHLDGTVTVAVGGGAPVPDPSALGVIAIASESLTAVLPTAIATGGTSATLQIEATFDETTLNSNAIEVTW